MHDENKKNRQRLLLTLDHLFAISLIIIFSLFWGVTVFANEVKVTQCQISAVGTKEAPTFDGGMIHELDRYSVKLEVVANNKRNIPDNSLVQIPVASMTQKLNNFPYSQNTQKILSRAIEKGYLPFVLAKLNELHLPPMLALIPVIESGYNCRAVSPKGAAGLWQLMPTTANHLGITANQRFNLAPSTRAALNHLNSLHQEFGSWELAMAAYNAGRGRVKRALDRLPYGTYEALNLPPETKHYVKLFIVLRRTFENNLL